MEHSVTFINQDHIFIFCNGVMVGGIQKKKYLPCSPYSGEPSDNEHIMRGGALYQYVLIMQHERHVFYIQKDGASKSLWKAKRRAKEIIAWRLKYCKPINLKDTDWLDRCVWSCE